MAHCTPLLQAQGSCDVQRGEKGGFLLAFHNSRFCSQGTRDRIRRNGLKLCQGDSDWILGKISSLKGWLLWNRLPRAMVESSSMEVSKKHMGVALGDMLSDELGSAWLRAGLHDLGGPFQP